MMWRPARNWAPEASSAALSRMQSLRYRNSCGAIFLISLILQRSAGHTRRSAGPPCVRRCCHCCCSDRAPAELDRAPAYLITICCPCASSLAQRKQFRVSYVLFYFLHPQPTPNCNALYFFFPCSSISFTFPLFCRAPLKKQIQGLAFNRHYSILL